MDISRDTISFAEKNTPSEGVNRFEEPNVWKTQRWNGIFYLHQLKLESVTTPQLPSQYEFSSTGIA